MENGTRDLDLYMDSVLFLEFFAKGLCKLEITAK